MQAKLEVTQAALASQGASTGATLRELELVNAARTEAEQAVKQLQQVRVPENAGSKEQILRLGYINGRACGWCSNEAALALALKLCPVIHRMNGSPHLGCACSQALDAAQMDAAQQMARAEDLSAAAISVPQLRAALSRAQVNPCTVPSPCMCVTGDMDRRPGPSRVHA